MKTTAPASVESFRASPATRYWIVAVILVLIFAAFAAYVVFVMIADARDPYGTPDPEDDGNPAS